MPTAKNTPTPQSVDLTESTTPAPDRHEVQDWFDRWSDQLGMRLPEFFGNRLPEVWGAGREIVGVMRVEEIIDDKGITIRGEIPGIDPEKDVDITVEGNRLTINAERRESEVKNEAGRHHSEFRYGSYRRSFPLPSGSSVDAIVATYQDGILEVHVPVQADQSELTRIPVKKAK